MTATFNESNESNESNDPSPGVVALAQRDSEQESLGGQAKDGYLPEQVVPLKTSVGHNLVCIGC